MLFMMFTIAMGVLTSVFYFNYGCNYSAILSLCIYGPVAATGVIAQSFWRKLTLRFFIWSMILCGILCVGLQWSSATYCDFIDESGNPKKNLNAEKWLPIIPTAGVFLIGSRLIWKKISDMNPNLTQRLSVETHSIVLVLTFAWPLTLGILYLFTTDTHLACEYGSISYLVCFGIPILWVPAVHIKHTKFTRNTLGYLLIFGPGMLGWFLFPMTAINCKPGYELSAWCIFAIFPLFSLLSGARFVKFYDVRHMDPEDLNKPKDHGFIDGGGELLTEQVGKSI
jgi:hypothetical protein